MRQWEVLMQKGIFRINVDPIEIATQCLLIFSLSAPIISNASTSETPPIRVENVLLNQKNAELIRQVETDSSITDLSHENQIHGFLEDSSLNLLLRNYYGYFNSISDRTAWVQGARLYFESGYTRGPIGIGLAMAPFFAVKLNGGRGAGNMVHVGPDIDSPNKPAWAFLGEYALKAKLFDLQMRYGLQTVVNPFLKPYDNRSLPPTFRGLSLTQSIGPEVSIKGGNFDAVNARGANHLVPLTTSYGGVEVAQLSYAGFEWERPAGTRAALYASTAKNLWNQYYVSLPYSANGVGGVQWIGKLDAYFTKGTGKQLQGQIDNRAFSAAVTGKSGASSLTFAYQKIVGNEYFDFVQETSGIYLANAMGNDFNAPHEKSVQLRYKFDGSSAFPGFTLTTWAISGWAADGTEGARRYADVGTLLHKLYWKNGLPVKGTHEEYAFNPSYTFQSGAFKTTRVFLVLTLHDLSKHYPGKTYLDWRLIADVPIKFF